METIHNPIQHLKYLRQSLSQDNESIGFFLSAGCPLSVDMPEKEWPLIPDVKNLTIYINGRLESNPSFKTLLSEIKKAEKDTENIEDILSFLRSLIAVSKGNSVRGLTEDDLLNLESKICKEIILKLNVTLPVGETPYHRLGSWIRSIERKNAVEIFTTNYDLLTEQALEELEVPYFDGFVGSRRSFFDLRAVEDGLIPIHWSRLWKIHGSINWYHEEVNSKEKKEKKVYRSSEIKEDASHLIHPSHLKYEESRKMPYLALIDQLNRFIRKKSSLLILSGYSFNDEHLNDTIISALKANPTAMVLGLLYETYHKKDKNNEFELDSDNEKIDQYPRAYSLASKQHNLNIWTNDIAIIGTNKGLWDNTQIDPSEDSDLRSFILSDQIDPTGQPQTHIKLGDFSVLTNFLKKIIGDPKKDHHV